MAKFVAEDVDARCILKVVGEVDVAAADELVKASQRCLDRSPVLELDLSELTFIDSSGLGALVRIRNEARQRDSSVALTNVTDSTARLLRITGLARVFGLESGKS